MLALAPFSLCTPLVVPHKSGCNGPMPAQPSPAQTRPDQTSPNRKVGLIEKVTAGVKKLKIVTNATDTCRQGNFPRGILRLQKGIDLIPNGQFE